MAEVLGEWRPRVLIFDEEFEPVVSDVAEDIDLIVAWPESDDVTRPTLDELIQTHKSVELTPPVECSVPSSSPQAPPDRRKAWPGISGPGDLRASPDTAGWPPAGTEVRLYDEVGRVVTPGKPGRIFVGNAMLVEGSERGGGTSMRDGVMGICGAT